MATPHSGAIWACLRLAGGPQQPLLVNRIEKVTPTEKAQSTLALWAISSNDKGPLALCVKKTGEIQPGAQDLLSKYDFLLLGLLQLP